MTHRPDSPALTSLRAATQGLHAMLDARMMALAPFDSVAGYGALARVNAGFLALVAPLFHDPALGRLIPDLPARDRSGAALADLADLGLSVPPGGAGPDPADRNAALGWLYVAEGSRLGATVLARGAARLGMTDGHGARHLAPSPGGAWRSFIAALDPALPDEDSRAAATRGAKAGFAAVLGLAARLSPAP